jgi:hypothetical protein
MDGNYLDIQVTSQVQLMMCKCIYVYMYLCIHKYIHNTYTHIFNILIYVYVYTGALLRTAKIVPQPGDGSCLFHSMSYGIRDKSNATSLRRDICSYIQHHPLTPICDTPLSDWVDWDSGTSCSDYARKMSYGAWGGGIEMACMSRLKDCNVHVYESLRSGGFKRISAFDNPIDPQLKRNVRVLYRGGVHYDALVKIE